MEHPQELEQQQRSLHGSGETEPFIATCKPFSFEAGSVHHQSLYLAAHRCMVTARLCLMWDLELPSYVNPLSGHPVCSCLYSVPLLHYQECATE
jgi:hypothetical protein